MIINLRLPAVKQFLRFMLVGVTNTLVTLIVIYACKSVWGINMWVSNAIGYVAGLINSFVWNKLWVFNSHGTKGQALAEAMKFGVGFLLCYGLQLLFTWFLTTPLDLVSMSWTYGGLTITGYGLSTILGMGVYTVANFIFNRLVTFRAHPSTPTCQKITK